MHALPRGSQIVQSKQFSLFRVGRVEVLVSALFQQISAPPSYSFQMQSSAFTAIHKTSSRLARAVTIVKTLHVRFRTDSSGTVSITQRDWSTPEGRMPGKLTSPGKGVN
jgi:hypothetical protein